MPPKNGRKQSKKPQPKEAEKATVTPQEQPKTAPATVATVEGAVPTAEQARKAELADILASVKAAQDATGTAKGKGKQPEQPTSAKPNTHRPLQFPPAPKRPTGGPQKGAPSGPGTLAAGSGAAKDTVTMIPVSVMEFCTVNLSRWHCIQNRCCISVTVLMYVVPS